MPDIEIFNGDCIGPSDRLPDASVHLGIHDPPFGIHEASFNKHYKRDASNVIPGYQEAPEDYGTWTRAWLAEATRVLVPDGSLYVVIGHSALRDVVNAAAHLGLHEINHIIWKYPFGVSTRLKYVTSHYHILYYCKSAVATPTFNLTCRHGTQERAPDGGSLLYRDIEDVFVIPRDNLRGETKNQNKLPDALIMKLIQYSSDPGDMVCDFFMGNFTSAYAARKLGRRVCGYEINPNAYDHHMPRVSEAQEIELPPVIDAPPSNQGKPLSEEDRLAIYNEYRELLGQNPSKKEASKTLQEKYGRGKFAIKNILDSFPDPEPEDAGEDIMEIFNR